MSELDGGSERSPMVERIEIRLAELGLTPITAATQHGYPRDTIRNVLRSDSNPRADTLVAIADALQTTVGWLVGDHENPSTPLVAHEKPIREPQAITVRPNGRVTIDIKAEVSVGVAAQILALIEGDGA